MKYTLLIVGLAAILTLASCTAMQTGDSLARMDEARGTLEQAEAIARGERDAADARGDAATVAAADKTLAELAKYQAQLDKARAAIVAAQGPDGSIGPEGVIGAAAPFIPPPWNLLALIGAPLVIGGIQELRKRRVENAAARVIDSIDILREASPDVGAAITRHKDLLHEWQGADGLALVRKVRNS